MIWYHIPPPSVTLMFVVYLLTTALQVVIVLESGALIQSKKALRYFQCVYGILACNSAALLLETLMITAYVEGGLYIRVPVYFHYFSIFPALLYSFGAKKFMDIPKHLRPMGVSFFVPLLRFPLVVLLPIPYQVFFAMVAALWFFMDAIWRLMAFRFFARTEITRNVMPYLIRNLQHGICVTNHKGWILETNPAFSDLCEKLGIQHMDHIGKLESSIAQLENSGQMNVIVSENGRSLRIRDEVFFLQQNVFYHGRKSLMQITLSDVTQLARFSIELEQRNQKLVHETQSLERAIDVITKEEIACERERLCRAAHDSWSQRLAVAGLSLDMLLELKGKEVPISELDNIRLILEHPETTGEEHPAGEISSMLQTAAGMYRRLGVKIHTSGKAAFSVKQQKLLHSVLREALANAVRHAYARHIAIRLFEKDDVVGVIVQNKCLDNDTCVSEGRGLHDIHTRIKENGGSVYYQKNHHFELRIVLPRINDKGRVESL